MKHTSTRTPRFDREWKEMIALLPENRQSAMEQAIRTYQKSGKEPEGLDGAEMMAFCLIKKIVDRRQRRREAARSRKSASPEAPEKSVTETKKDECALPKRVKAQRSVKQNFVKSALLARDRQLRRKASGRYGGRHPYQ